MKKTILYAITAAAIVAAAAITIGGCGGDFGERSEKMNAFLDKFAGNSDTLRYTITFKANGGNGSPPKPIKVTAGSQITLPNATSSEGTLTRTDYVFDGWSTDSSGIKDTYNVGDPFTPKSNVTLYARWIRADVVTFSVTVISAGTGFSGGGSYESGKTVTINAGDAPAGQQFQNWTASPSVTFANQNNQTTTFTMPTQNVTVTARFTAIPADKFPVTVLSIGVGGTGSSSYTSGATVTINAGADPFGHRFQNWTTESNGVIFGNANNRTTTFIMPENTVTVTANFYEVPTYKVTIVSEGNGASRDSSYREGDTVTIKAGTAPDKMRFKNWTTESGGVTFFRADTAITKFVMPADSVKVTANFQANTYTVTVYGGTGATGGGEYYPGATVSITAGTIPVGFVFKGWTSSNSSVVFADAKSETTTFAMPSAAVTVTANLGGGTFTDSRDGQTYGTVIIGGKIWMSENLNYQTSSGSWCYDNKTANCDMYGRLYDWSTANTVCPSGWHLPSRQEWGDLAKAADGTGDYGAGGTAGKKLKSTSNGNGTDDYGFSALSGGYRDFDGMFHDAHNVGFWWTATETGSGSAYNRGMSYKYDYVIEDYRSKSNGLSVRCLSDN